MSLEQRRVVVLERQEFPAGHVRLIKASSRYDRRRRYWVVEVLPAAFVGAELVAYMWRVVADFAVSSAESEAKAWEAYHSAWLTVRALS